MLLSTAQQLNRLSLTSLLFTSCLLQIFCLLFFFARRGRGRAVHGRRQRGRSATRHASSHGAPEGRAGRRPPCPNGAPLDFFGRVARREEAAGASRWGLGSENRPSRRCAENTGQLLPGIFRSVSGPNSYGKPPIGRSQGRGGGWPPLRPPLARGSSVLVRFCTCFEGI